ncbi:hypothetical protein HRbin02_00198 [Candidatus Calditenuaceae archaeon HR02]|nr:hypothetical protein HRbin02_00198 [Candidatus Calditenuaceae archaeon HR02]
MVVKDYRAGPRQAIPANQALADRVRHVFWLISAKSPYRKRVTSGDSCLFYVSSKLGKVIASNCVISSPPNPITHNIKASLRAICQPF